MENLPTWVTIIGITLIVLFGLIYASRESFSSSGLTMSNEDCHKLTNVYMNPDNEKYVCGHKRRETIDSKFGNYYTVNGILI